MCFDIGFMPKKFEHYQDANGEAKSSHHAKYIFCLTTLIINNFFDWHMREA